MVTHWYLAPMEKVSFAIDQAMARVLNCWTFWPDQMFEPARPFRMGAWLSTMLGIVSSSSSSKRVETYVIIITQFMTAPTMQPMTWIVKVCRGDRWTYCASFRSRASN